MPNTPLFRLALITAIVGFIGPSIAMFPYTRDNGTIKRVVIDAGHGGHDSGNAGTGRYKTVEKHISLDVALMVGNYIKENIPGVEVIYTRDHDEFIGLKERAALANRLKADLFMSIHCNAAAAKGAYGTETFVMGLTREKANLEVARNENSAILLEDNYEEKYEGLDPNDPQAAMIASMTSNAFLNQSARLAQLVQDQFKNRVHRRDRGVKQSVLYVLDFSVMPSVLIELGFLTNKTEEDFLNTQRGKELMASSIYRAFKQYKIEHDAVDELHTGEDQPMVNIDQNQTETTPAPTDKPATDTKEKELVVMPEAAVNKPVFKIQIAASDKNLPCTPSNFSGLSPVEMYKDYKLYKYTFGQFKTFKEAKSQLTMVRAKGFKDAFIVAFLKDERIDINKARQIQP